MREKKVVFIAISKKLFYFRMDVSDFVLKKGFIPLNPFMIFDFLLFEEVNKESIRNANNSLIGKSEELWVFGDLNSDLKEDIKKAKELNKKIKYFSVNNRKIREIRKR